MAGYGTGRAGVSEDFIRPPLSEHNKCHGTFDQRTHADDHSRVFLPSLGNLHFQRLRGEVVKTIRFFQGRCAAVATLSRHVFIRCRKNTLSRFLSFSRPVRAGASVSRVGAGCRSKPTDRDRLNLVSELATEIASLWLSTDGDPESHQESTIDVIVNMDTFVHLTFSELKFR